MPPQSVIASYGPATPDIDATNCATETSPRKDVQEALILTTSDAVHVVYWFLFQYFQYIIYSLVFTRSSTYLVQWLMHFGLQVIVFYLIFNQCPGLVVYVFVLCSFYFGTHLAQGTPK